MAMVYIVAVLIGLLLVGIYVGNNSYKWDMEGAIVAMISGSALFIMAIIWPIVYMDTRSKIVEFKAVEATIEISREENISAIERAALVNKMTDWNAWLASRQYWNSTVFDTLYPDEVMELRPIK